MIGTGLLLALAFLLIAAAAAKLRRSVAVVPLAELALAATVVVTPGRAGGVLLTAAFAAFASPTRAAGARAWRVASASAPSLVEGGRRRARR